MQEIPIGTGTLQQQCPKDGAIKVKLLITKIKKHIPVFDFEE